VLISVGSGVFVLVATGTPIVGNVSNAAAVKAPVGAVVISGGELWGLHAIKNPASRNIQIKTIPSLSPAVLLLLRIWVPFMVSTLV
jgi:hypothetical protein